MKYPLRELPPQDYHRQLQGPLISRRALLATSVEEVDLMAQLVQREEERQQREECSREEYCQEREEYRRREWEEYRREQEECRREQVEYRTLIAQILELLRR